MNIEKKTLKNNNFREVLFTGPHSQLVVMSLLAGEEIGEEVHKVDQFLRIEKGAGKTVIDGMEHEITNGSSISVPAGVKHNIINTSAEPMKLYTVYSPPQHIDGRVHATKADAEADKEDELFGG